METNFQLSTTLTKCIYNIEKDKNTKNNYYQISLLLHDKN